MRSKVIAILLVLALVCVMTVTAACASAAELVGMRTPFKSSVKSSGAREALGEVISDSTEVMEDRTIDGVNIKNPSEYYGVSVWSESDEPVNLNVLGDFIIDADMKDNPYWLYALELYEKTAAAIGKDFVFNLKNVPDLVPSYYEDYDITGVNLTNASSLDMKDFTMNVLADPDSSGATYPIYGIYSYLYDGDIEQNIKTGNVNVTAVADCDVDYVSLTALELSVDEYDDMGPWKSTVWANGSVNASASAKNGDVDVHAIYADAYYDGKSKGGADIKIDGAVNAEVKTGDGYASAYAVTLFDMPVTFTSGSITANAQSDSLAAARALRLMDPFVEKVDRTAVVNGSIIANAEVNKSDTDVRNAEAYALSAKGSEDQAQKVTVNGDVIAKAVNHAEYPDDYDMDEAIAIEADGGRTDITVNGNVKAEGVGPYLYVEGVDADDGALVNIDGDIEVTAEGKDADGVGVYAYAYDDDERPTAVTARDIKVTVNSGEVPKYSYGIEAYGPAKVQVENVTVKNGTGVSMTKDAHVTINGDLNVPSTGLVKSAIELSAGSESENGKDKGSLVITGTVNAPDGAGITVSGNWIDKDELVSKMRDLVPDIYVHSFKVGGNIAEGKGVDSEGVTEYDLTQEEMQEFLNGINYIVNIAEPRGYSLDVTGGADWSDDYGFYYAQAGDAVDFSVSLPDLKHGIRYVTGGDDNQIIDRGNGAYSLIVDKNGGVAIDVHLFETVYAAIGRTYNFGGKMPSGEPMKWLCTKVDHGVAKLRLIQGYEKGSEPDNEQLLESLPESLRSIMVKDEIEYEDDISERFFKDGLSHPIVYVNVFDITY